MSYYDIYRSWERIMKTLKEGNERERETWKKIMKDCKKARKTTQDYVKELCEKNRRKDEEEFNKLNNLKTPKLERDIILCKYFCIAMPLALTGYEYNPFHKSRKK